VDGGRAARGQVRGDEAGQKQQRRHPREGRDIERRGFVEPSAEEARERLGADPAAERIDLGADGRVVGLF